MSKEFESIANRPTDENNKQYHIKCGVGDVAKYVLLPGDPKRVERMSQFWDKAKLMADYREHVTYTGKIGDMEISACSTGAGGGSTASAIEDLVEIGAETLIRVGTCGAIQEDILPGDLIICTGAVRMEGTSNDYVTNSYPAVASYEVTLALITAAEKLGYRYHVGIGYTAASFFCGQARPGVKGYHQSHMKTIVEDMQMAGVLNFEMEAATVLTLASVYKLRAGAIFTVVANRAVNSFKYTNDGVDRNIEVATEAMKLLHEWDTKKQQQGKKYYYPGV